MNLQEKRELNTGFGDALARAFELVVTPGVFALLGWLLDRRLGTTPLFAFVFFFLVLGYVVWTLWMGYEADMQRHEQGLGVGKASDRVE
jgi:F0F1-type ATP synthase assembly protein I